jgi:hypothetical protein
MQFIGSSSSPLLLDFLYLSGIKATNLVFHWCQLNNVVFDYSYQLVRKILVHADSIKMTSLDRA